MGSAKDPDAFRTISEVSELVGVPAHILRFWETRFPDLKPLQRGGNRRYYRPHDVQLAQALHKLLHQDGYTVKGVQRLIAERGAKALLQQDAAAAPPSQRARAPVDLAPVDPAPLDPAPFDIARLRAIRDRLAAALHAAP